MIIDRGFFVENYVGEYEMEFNQELNATFIVSKEFNHAEGGEVPLRKKRIFEYDRKDDEYVFLALANIDPSNNDSILKYCNKYGLPCSSQICFDEESGIDDDVDADVARQISKGISDYYSGQDAMDRLQFCKFAVQIRRLMELKEFLDRPNMDKEDWSKLIPLLTYLLFYSREYMYDYDETDPLPSTRLMRLQYSYQLFRRVRRNFTERLSPADQVSTFLNIYKRLIADTDRIKDIMTFSDLECESRVEIASKEGSSNSAEDVNKQASRRTNLGGGLDIGEGVEPVEETFNLLG